MSSSRSRGAALRRRVARVVLAVAVLLPGSDVATADGRPPPTPEPVGEVVVPRPDPGPARGDSSSYRLYRNPDGSRVRFDPCRPLTVRINAPSTGADADAREALARLAAASGLRFVLTGATTFVPTRAQRTLPGTDLVISWAPPADRPGGSDVLDARQLGTGGWASAGTRTGAGVVWRATGGFAVLDATRDAELDPGFGPGLTRGALLLHEIAHALGVDHVDDPDQLMTPVLRPRSTPVALGAGDRSALAAVGAPAGCLPR